MFECHNCGNAKFVSEVFLIDGRRVLVEHIAAEVCDHCDEAVFSAETAEQVRRMVHSATPPIKTIPLDVFTLA